MNRKTRLNLRGMALLLLVMVCTLSACGTTESQNSAPAPAKQSPSPQEGYESDVPESQQEADAVNTGRNITLSFGDRVITAILDDSETAKAFLERLPMTISMSRYADREYYAAIDELPENGEAIPDYENGDITYYTSGKSLAIFFGNADSSNQNDLIRMGRITSDLSIFDDMSGSEQVAIAVVGNKGGTDMNTYDFSVFTNVDITGIDISALSGEELAVLYRQAKYCQAMTEADTKTMSTLVAEDMMFTHMSGMQQTRAEYFGDIEDGNLQYFTIGIENPVIELDGDFASITYTSILNANAYGARGTYRMKGTHRFENVNGQWVSTNAARN